MTRSAVIAPLKANVQGTVPGNMNYFSFVAPGLLMMIVMMGAMTGIPRAIAHEKEIGTFDGILAAPVNEISIIIGQDAGADGARLHPGDHRDDHRHTDLRRLRAGQPAADRRGAAAGHLQLHRAGHPADGAVQQRGDGDRS